MTELNVDMSGSGPALVLVNGAWCNLHQWDRLVDRLAEHFTVIRHDVRGTGQSAGGPDDEYTFEHYAEDVVGLVNDAGFERFSVWGMAWGARVAVMTAAVHGARIDRVVLSDLGIDPADVDAQKQGRVDAKAARVEAGVDEASPIDGAFDHADRDLALRALNATRLHPDLMPFVERISLPTLIATGEFDPNLVSSRRALAGLSDGRLEVLPLTEHGSVLHRADGVLEVVVPFLAG